MRPAAPGVVRCSRCGYDLAGQPESRCPECGRPPFEPPSPEDAVDHSVWDEPTLSTDIAGAPPADAVTYAAWLQARQRATSRLESWCACAGLAVAAGPFAVIGAMRSSSETFVGVLLAVVFAPVIEEVMKIAAVTWALERKPYWFTSARQLLLCCISGGAVFAALENILYLHVYIRQPTPEIIAWRWTVCVALHTGCSLIAGLGLARIWRRTMSARTRPDLGTGYRYLLTAIVIHATYNALAVLFSQSLFAGR